MQNVLAVILGGGAGSRLYPLTRERAKPAVPIGGKYRLIDIPISNCLNSGIDRIFVLTQYLSASLNRHISWTYNNMGLFSRGWVQILAAEQGLGMTPTTMADSWYLGTADAVRKQMLEIDVVGPNEVLILSGDHLYRMDYASFVDYHRQTGADVTVAVQPVTPVQASGLGILATDASGAITRWCEKPSDPTLLASLRSREDPKKPYLASMGIYVFSRQALRKLLANAGDSDFGLHVIPRALDDQYKVSAYTFEGFWADIGTIRSFYEVNLALTHPGFPFDFFDEVRPIFTHPRFLPATRVENCSLDHVLISEGGQLCQATISESVIGLRSVIGCHTRMSRTMMIGADYYDREERSDPSGRRHSIPLGVGEGCEIEGAILDKNVRIGHGVVVRPHGPDENLVYPTGSKQGEELYVLRDGIVVIPKNTEIPDGMVI